MKTLTLLFALAMMCLKAHSQTISADSAKYYEHKKVTVCSTITGVHESPKVTYLNFGPGYPNQTFTAVIFAADKPKFAKITFSGAMPVCITGTIELYKGKPEIILKDTSQLQLK